MKETVSFTLVIPSSLEFRELAIASLDWLIETYAGVDPNETYPGQLPPSWGLRETVSNAIEHGNKYSPEKKVTITYTFSEGTFIISVQDEGSGFVPEAVPDCLGEANILCDGGRGIKMMREIFTKVTFEDDGRRTTLELTFAPIAVTA